MKVLSTLTSSNPHSKALPIALLLIGALFLSVLSGMLAAFGNIILLIVLLALFGLFFVLATPVPWTIWIIFWATFLITGPSAYFLRFTQLQWLTVLVGAALLLPVLLNLFHRKFNFSSIQITSHILLPGIFLFLVAFSTIINDPQFGDFINASRHYLFMWPLMLVFMFGLVSQEMQAQLWRALLVIAVLQLPMALYQYLFVAQKTGRGGAPSWDAIIGTFQGNSEGGGDSAAMAIMLLIAILTAIALWRSGKLHGALMTLVVLSGLGTLALAEVKAAVILLPIVIGLYYYKELFRRPVESIMAITCAVLLVGGIFMAYEKLHYGSAPIYTINKNQPTSNYERVMRALDPAAESAGGRQLGRVHHMVNWWEINVKSGDLKHSLFGYGMGATHVSRVGVGELASRYSYVIHKSSTIILLWETGILGYLAFLVILLSGSLASGRLAKNETIPETHRVFLRVGSIGLLLLAVTTLYKEFHFYSNPTQFLMMFMLGQAAYWSRFVKNNQVNEKS